MNVESAARRVVTEATLAELRRMRWILIGLTVAFAVLGWFTAGVLWVGAVVALVLAVRNEWVMHQGRRLLR